MKPTIKTIARYEALVKNERHIWLKSEILGLKKLLNNYNHIDDLPLTERVIELGRYVQESMKPARITPEQTKFGLGWLKSRLFTRTGKPSMSAEARSLAPIARILPKFKEFRFAGFHARTYGQSSVYFLAPVYNVVAKGGETIPYASEHWGSTFVGDYEVATHVPYLTSSRVQEIQRHNARLGQGTLDECSHNECDSTCSMKEGAK